jgi:hypothetical protein
MLLPITRYLVFTLLFSLGLMLGLMGFMPVSVIAHVMQKNVPEVTIGSATGYWWQGQLNHVRWQQLSPATLAWRLNLSALLRGQLVAEINVAQQLIHASTEVALPISQLLNPSKVQITGAQAKVDIDQLTPYAPYPLPHISGQVTVFVEQLGLDLAALNNASSNLPIIILDSPVRFSTSKVVVLDDILMGKFNGQITNNNKPLGYKVTLQSAASEVNIAGYSLLSSHEIKSQYLVQPSPRTDPKLIKLLDMMGQKLQNGDYRFNTSYAL